MTVPLGCGRQALVEYGGLLVLAALRLACWAGYAVFDHWSRKHFDAPLAELVLEADLEVCLALIWALGSRLPMHMLVEGYRNFVELVMVSGLRR